MEPSPQRTPVLAQAGGSPAGLDFAAAHAELMFLSAYSPETIAQQVGSVRELARAKGGRRDGDILFLQGGLMFVVGSTDEEAFRMWGGELEEWRSPEAQTAYFSSLSGMDLGRYDPATPLEDIIAEIPGIQGAFLSMINAWPAGSKPTVKDFLTSMSLPQMVVGGSPETIVARLREFQAAGGVDGVQVMNILMPQSYDEFFEHLVPVLQREGADADRVPAGNVAGEAVRRVNAGRLRTAPGPQVPRDVLHRMTASSPTTTILVLLGSLRRASINRQLAEVAIDNAPSSIRMHLFDRLGELPLYNEDIDTEHPAEAVVALRAAATEADALLAVTPEYNGGVPRSAQERDRLAVAALWSEPGER